MLHILKRIKNAATCHMVANILPTDTPPPPRHLGRESRMQQHGSKYFAPPPYPYSPPPQYFACRPPPSPTMRMGSVGQNSTFSEHGHVAYQIKENHTCSNMAANIFPSRQCPSQTLTLGMGSICLAKFYFFRTCI